jgi:hypothetical protein
MISLQVFAAVLAIGLVVLVLWLIRRDRLPISHSIWWLSISILIAMFGLFPELLNTLARIVGVDYPPSLLFILGILTLFFKVLIEDLELSTTRRRLLRLAQRTAILEQELNALKEKNEHQNSL